MLKFSLNKAVVTVLVFIPLSLGNAPYKKPKFSSSCSYALEGSFSQGSIKQYQDFRSQLAEILRQSNAKSFEDYIIVEDGKKLNLLFANCVNGRKIWISLNSFGKSSGVFSARRLTKRSLQNVIRRFSIK